MDSNFPRSRPGTEKERRNCNKWCFACGRQPETTIRLAGWLWETRDNLRQLIMMAHAALFAMSKSSSTNKKRLRNLLV